MSSSMKQLWCSVCMCPVDVDVDTDEVVCGYCVIQSVTRKRLEEVERLSAIPPDKAKALRKKKGLTQKHLAGILGVSVQAIREYEQGKTHCPEPYFDWLQKGKK